MGVSRIFPEYEGESKTITELAKEIGISRNALYKRIYRKGVDLALIPKVKKRGGTYTYRKATEAEIEGAKMLRSLTSSLPNIQEFFDNAYFDIQDKGITDRISDKIRRNLIQNKAKIKGAADIIERIYVAPELKKPSKNKEIEWIDIHVAVCNAYTKKEKDDKKMNEEDMNVLIGGVANFFETTVEALKGKNRSSNLVTARMFFSYICYPKVSLSKIGRFLGGRNHATVINYISNMQYDLAHDAKITKKYSEIKNTLEL